MTKHEFHFIPSDRHLSLERKPVRVWTVLALKDGKPDIAEDELLQHLNNVFLEDRIHDWNWKNGVLYYYSRVSMRNCWVCVEYEG